MFSSQKDPFEEKIDRFSTEIAALEEINQHYMNNMRDIIQHREREMLANSLKGWIYKLLARLLVIYGIYKVIASSINVIFMRKYSIDPISRSLQLLGYLIYIEPIFIEFVVS